MKVADWARRECNGRTLPHTGSMSPSDQREIPSARLSTEGTVTQRRKSGLIYKIKSKAITFYIFTQRSYLAIYYGLLPSWGRVWGPQEPLARSPSQVLPRGNVTNCWPSYGHMKD
jgi:hypothetical protein